MKFARQRKTLFNLQLKKLLTRIFHESLAATTDIDVLPGVLGCSFDRLRTGSPCDVLFTLMLQIHTEKKRARVPQMWLRTGSDRSKRTEPYVMILAEASKAADGVLSREHSDFGRCGSAILGFGTPRIQSPAVARWHAHLRGLATAIHGISGL